MLGTGKPLTRQVSLSTAEGAGQRRTVSVNICFLIGGHYYLIQWWQGVLEMFIFRSSELHRQWWRENLENVYQTFLTTINNIGRL